MIRQLAQCPFCQACEIALNDSLDVVFNPDAGPDEPCPHLVWVEGRYSQWGLSPLVGRKTKLARIIGSNEFEWQHPSLAAREDAGELRAFLKDLIEAGSGWDFAPAEQHAVRTISLDAKLTEGGREYPNWEIEGAAIFAANASAFLGSLPGCMQRRRSAFTDLPGSSSG